jgi:hypothetical protein
MLRAAVEAHLPDDARLLYALLKQPNFLIAVADQFGMQSEGGVHVTAPRRPRPVLGPSHGGRCDRHRDDPLSLAAAHDTGRITVKIDVAVEIKTANLMERDLHGRTFTLFRVAATSATPRRNTWAY